jgi:hypothetical protein
VPDKGVGMGEGGAVVAVPKPVFDHRGRGGFVRRFLLPAKVRICTALSSPPPPRPPSARERGAPGRPKGDRTRASWLSAAAVFIRPAASSDSAARPRINGDPGARRIAVSIGARCIKRFCSASWRPAPGDEGRVIEPGHHFEWGVAT